MPYYRSREFRSRRPGELEFELIHGASEVLRKVDPQNPADAVLRAELKSQRHLSPESSGAISRAVFAYYRWWRWLGEQPVADQLHKALALQERFSKEPSDFSFEELASKAVPSWVSEQVSLSPDWLRALQSEPKPWLRARPGQGRELMMKLEGCRPAAPLADTLEYSGEKDLFRTPEFHAGEFEIQDISSQLVSLLSDPQPGETWWDACAGEGGKTLHLADLMRNKGLIWASDRAAWRLKKLKRRAARAKVFNYRSSLWEGGAKLPTKTKFDGVLLDAPCSGLGTWQRNPHARWTTTPLDVHELGEVQRSLLAHAAAAVKPGGKLVYAVCTLTRTETVEVTQGFEKRFSEFQPLQLPNLLQPGAPSTAPLWVWPQDCGGNGMFVAAWQRSL